MIIYKVTNKINGFLYIGKTTRSIIKRKIEHERSIKHNNIKMLFHIALKTYGIENFDWDIIDKATSYKELCDKEKYWIKELNCRGINKGYNISAGGDFGDTLSMHHNRKEIIKKIIKNNVYKKYPEKKLELSKKMSGENNPMYGKNYQVHGLLKFTKYKKNKKLEDIFSIEKVKEIKLKMSIASKNRRLTETQKQHLKLINSGIQNPNYKKLSKNIINDIIEEYSKTKVLQEISDKLNISCYLIQRTLKENNIFEKRSHHEIVSGKNNPRFIEVSDNLKKIIEELHNHNLNFSIISIRNILLSCKIDLSKFKIKTILKERNNYKKRRYITGNVIINKKTNLKNILNNEILKNIEIESLNYD